MISLLAEFFGSCMPCWGPSLPEERSTPQGHPHGSTLTQKEIKSHFIVVHEESRAHFGKIFDFD